MIEGAVTDEGVPEINLNIVGENLPATVDTGFHGDLELPGRLFTARNPRFVGQTESELAGGQTILSSLYEIAMTFDGQDVIALTTFVAGGEALAGTHLMKEHRLKIAFPAKTVRLQRHGE